MQFEKRSVTRTTYADVRTNAAGIAVFTENTHGGQPNERRPAACLLVAHESPLKPRGRGDCVNLRLDAERVRTLHAALGEVLKDMEPTGRGTEEKGAT